MVKPLLMFAYKTEGDAKEAVIRKIYGHNPGKYRAYSYTELFDSRKSKIYLKDLKELINSNWEHFQGFWDNQERFIMGMDLLNKEGRFEAHATIPDEDEIKMIEAAINIVQKGIDKYKAAFDLS